MDLKDKVAIFTGASSSIGRAVARNLNRAGVKFILTGRREDRLVKLGMPVFDIPGVEKHLSGF